MTVAEVDLVQSVRNAVAQGRVQEALDGLIILANANSGDAGWAFSHAAYLQEVGFIAEAEAAYRAVLLRWPDQVPARVNLAEILIGANRLAEADDHLSHLATLGLREMAPLKRLLQVRLALGRLAGIDDVAQAVLALDPNDFDAWTCLGAAARGRQPELALLHLRRALTEAPANPQAHVNLAIAYLDLGRGATGVEIMKNAQALAPDDPMVLMNLANALETGNAMMDPKITREAKELYRRALDVGGDPRNLWFNLATSHKRLGEIDQARDCCRQLENVAGIGGWSVRELLLAPRVFDSVAAIEAERHRILQGLDRLETYELRLADPVTTVGETAFGLAYHNENDLVIQRRFAAFYKDRVPDLEWVAPHCQTLRPRGARKLRLGLVGSYLHNKTMDNLNEGLIRHIDRDRFELVLFRPGGAADADSDAIDSLVDDVRYFGSSLEGAREIVARAECDVLFYFEIGMVTLTYFLAFSRLAPVQCTTWGHPDTTGIPALDYFLSSSLLEPEGAEQHYSERLIKLGHLPTCYLWPLKELPNDDRAGMGLPATGRIYSCPQNLMKVHPDFDRAIAAILRRDPDGYVVFTTSVLDVWRPVLHNRIAASYPDVADRVLFLPQMPRWDFLRLLKISDVVLDPFYFSGGNSTHEALALGSPVVTWPGPYMRGRVTLACYRRMGMDDLVCASPEDFVDLALRVGSDRSWRTEISRKIAERARILFDNVDAIREMERFFLAAHAAAEKGEWLSQWNAS